MTYRYDSSKFKLSKKKGILNLNVNLNTRECEFYYMLGITISFYFAYYMIA